MYNIFYLLSYMEHKKHWAWNNYTKLIQSKREDREKYINALVSENILETQIKLQDELFSENKNLMLRNTKRTTQSVNERLPILQKSGNPFMNNNYIQHLDQETEFLRPKNSNVD
jgi:hypothetical protein